MWVQRTKLRDKINAALNRSRIAALLGPRQCGKTAMARRVSAEEQTAASLEQPGRDSDIVPLRKTTYFDLEDPTDLRRLENPSLALEPLTGLVIIDEIQRKPQLFQLLRVLADRLPLPAKFLILGSASPGIIRQSSETLAGRIEFIYMSGFDLEEVGPGNLKRLWHRGGFPLSYLASNIENSSAWRENFIHTFLERDLRNLGIDSPPPQLRRFWTMLAHMHGQIWNASQISSSLGFSNMTARRYLDILEGAFMVRVLQPWFENTKKRQVKSPKVYIRDTGLFHSLLEIHDERTLLGHPKLGASWEGFALDQVVRHFQVRSPYFWATHAGAELDLLVTLHGKRFGFEFKYNDAPGTTRAMHVALEELQLEHLFVIYPGQKAYRLKENISVLPIDQLDQLAPYHESSQ